MQCFPACASGKTLCDSVQSAAYVTVNPFYSNTFSGVDMNIAIEPILALVVGILILAAPRFLNYFVAVYLIVVGILGLIHR